MLLGGARPLTGPARALGQAGGRRSYPGAMSEAVRLSLAEFVVLAVLDEAPRHGFAVASPTATQAELGRVWLIPRPVVYRSLARLEAEGS